MTLPSGAQLDRHEITCAWRWRGWVRFTGRDTRLVAIKILAPEIINRIDGSTSSSLTVVLKLDGGLGQ